MSRAVIIHPTPCAGPDVTGVTIGIVGALGALGLGPLCFWLARVGGVL